MTPLNLFLTTFATLGSANRAAVSQPPHAHAPLSAGNMVPAGHSHKEEKNARVVPDYHPGAGHAPLSAAHVVPEYHPHPGAIAAWEDQRAHAPLAAGHFAQEAADTTTVSASNFVPPPTRPTQAVEEEVSAGGVHNEAEPLWGKLSEYNPGAIAAHEDQSAHAPLSAAHVVPEYHPHPGAHAPQLFGNLSEYHPHPGAIAAQEDFAPEAHHGAGHAHVAAAHVIPEDHRAMAMALAALDAITLDDDATPVFPKSEDTDGKENPEGKAMRGAAGAAHEAQSAGSEDNTVEIAVGSAAAGLLAVGAGFGANHVSNQRRKESETTEVDMEAERYILEWSTKNVPCAAEPNTARRLIPRPDPSEFEPVAHRKQARSRRHESLETSPAENAEFEVGKDTFWMEH